MNKKEYEFLKKKILEYQFDPVEKNWMFTDYLEFNNELMDFLKQMILNYETSKKVHNDMVEQGLWKRKNHFDETKSLLSLWEKRMEDRKRLKK